MKTKLLRKLRRKYFNLYIIRYSDERSQWQLYKREVDIFDRYYEDYICSKDELPDIQDRLRKLVNNHIVGYLKKHGRDPLHPNKYLW